MLLSWGDIFVSGLPLPFLFLSMFLMSQLIPEQRFHCYWVEVAVGLPKSTCPQVGAWSGLLHIAVLRARPKTRQ